MSGFILILFESLINFVFWCAYVDKQQKSSVVASDSTGSRIQAHSVDAARTRRGCGRGGGSGGGQGRGGEKGHSGINSAPTQQPGEQEQYKYYVLVHNHYYK